MPLQNDMDLLGIPPVTSEVEHISFREGQEIDFMLYNSLFKAMQRLPQEEVNISSREFLPQNVQDGGKISNFTGQKISLEAAREPFRTNLVSIDTFGTAPIRTTLGLRALNSAATTGKTVQDILGGIDSGNEGGPEGPDGAGTGMPDLSQVSLGMLSPTGLIASAISGIATELAFQAEEEQAVAAQAQDPTSTTVGHAPSQTGITGLFGMHDVSDAQIQAEIDQAQLDVAAEEAQAAQAAADLGFVGQDEADAAAAAAEGHGATGTSGVAGEGSEGHDASDAGGIGVASGGQIKEYRLGDLVEDTADTTLEDNVLGPMGLVADIDGETKTGIADDLPLELEEGSYVLNADAVELAGAEDLNTKIKEAIKVAAQSDEPLPKGIDPTKRVPIKISNGEFVIPKALVAFIGLDYLEKLNEKGLAYRKKKEAEAQEETLAQEQALPAEIKSTV